MGNSQVATSYVHVIHNTKCVSQIFTDTALPGLEVLWMGLQSHVGKSNYGSSYGIEQLLVYSLSYGDIHSKPFSLLNCFFSSQ